jgi:peptide deformylase
MMLMEKNGIPLIYGPNPKLKQVSDRVENFDNQLIDLLDGMTITMKQNRGIGLAAVQVGVMKRAIVVDRAILKEKNEAFTILSGEPHYPNPDMFYIVNAEVLESSNNLETQEEGCLSYPNVYVPITRPNYIKFKFQDTQGNEIIAEATELMGRCVQHEIDHTNGKVIIDGLSVLKREMALKKVAKYVKLQASDKE